MIAADTSALVAVAFGEPEADTMAQLLLTSPIVMAATCLLELETAATRKEPRSGAERMDAFLDLLVLDVVAVDRDLANEARLAWRRFGKGRHPAALNFGDCFSYALAKTRDLPLLFKGDDFAQTDIRSALA